MIDADNIPKVDDEELLARFALSKKHFRKQDNTVRHQLFMPYKYVELSVNRHRDCPKDELWKIGFHVSEECGRKLRGRADILAKSCRIEPLDVQADPIPGNQNHANIIGFPPKKEDQLSLAQHLASSSSLQIYPETETG